MAVIRSEDGARSAERSDLRFRSEICSGVEPMMAEGFLIRFGVQPKSTSSRESAVYSKVPKVITWFGAKFSTGARWPIELA